MKKIIFKILLIVLSGIPLLSSSDTTMVFSIYALPSASFSGNTAIVENSSENYTIAIQSGATYIWDVTGGEALIKNQNTIDVIWGHAGNGKIKLKITSAEGCVDSSEKTIAISPQSSNPDLIIKDYDFGKKIVNDVVNRSCGHTGAVNVTNKRNETVIIDSFNINNQFLKITSQFPVYIPANASISLSARFAPTEIKNYSATLNLFSNGNKSSGTLSGEGIQMPPNASITEIELSADKIRVYPGDIVTLRIWLKSETPALNKEKQEFTAHIEYDRTVLQWLDTTFVARIPGQINMNSQILKINSKRAKGSDHLFYLKFRALLGLSDSSKIIFTDTEDDKSFIWNDTSIVAYPALIDSVVYINICRADGNRLLLQSVKSEIALLSPNPANDEIEFDYSLMESGKVEIVLLNSIGEEKKILICEYKNSGSYQMKYSAEDLESGVYFILMKTPSEVIKEKIILIK